MFFFGRGVTQRQTERGCAMSQDQPTAVPSSAEWLLIEALMGEPMTPTGWLRWVNYYPGITQAVLEREWRGSLGTIWARCHD